VKDAFLSSMIAAALGHGAAFGLVLAMPAPSRAPRTTNVALEIVAERAPLPPALEPRPAEPTPPPEPPEPPLPRHPREVTVERAPTEAARQNLPPPDATPDEPPPTDAPPAPDDATPQLPAFGVTMDSLVSQNAGLAAPVGGSRYGAIGGRRGQGSARAGAGMPARAAVAPTPLPSGLRVLPEIVGRVEPVYPAQAREEEIEGRVHLRLFVDRVGRVTRAEIVRGLGHGLDQAAIAAARRLRFRPGTIGGVAAPMEIPFSFAFLLE